MKNLKLISPAPKGKYCNKTGKTSFPQLNLRIIESLTPEHIHVSIFDERIEDIDFSDTPDLVGITVLTSVAPRAYEIADQYRSRGIPVILGGIHPSLMQEEALEHADAIVVGEVEGLWTEVIEDAQNKSLKKKYIGTKSRAFETSFPKLRPVSTPEAYSVPHTLQTTRGCPFDCEFCSVTSLWGNKYRFRPVEEVITEMTRLDARKIIIVDDNVVGSKKHSTELFEKMIPLNIKWAGQASITLAKDENLLRLLKKSGCEWLFIGIESLSEKNLSEMNKKFNDIENLEKNITKIKKAGINVVGSFIFGLENDDKTVFDDVVDFCIRTKIDAANFYLMTPLPGTSVFDKYEKEGRLLTKDWTLYDGNHVVFQHKKMSSEELLEGYISAYRRLYSLSSIFKRVSGFSKLNLEMLGFNLMRMKRRKEFAEWSSKTQF